MAHVILIYAHCVNHQANGDYALAGLLARDLAKEIAEQELDIRVVLTSMTRGMASLERLYGKASRDTVVIDGLEVGLTALETFDAVEHEVIAFIEANRCKHAPAIILKRVLSSNSKLISINAANKPVIPKNDYFVMLNRKQPSVYSRFFSGDFMLGVCGFGVDRIGLPSMQEAKDLPPLSTEEYLELPEGEYAFGYLSNIFDKDDYLLLAQYLKLTTQYNHYVFVGPIDIGVLMKAYAADKTLSSNARPVGFLTHSQLESRVMRQVIAHAGSTLVVATGVMSTMELMLDKKLPYYQYMSSNEYFVASYLTAIKSICINDRELSAVMLPLIIELSTLLFAPKPLSKKAATRTQALLAMPYVSDYLSTKNRAMVQEANGRLAPKLLSFIGSTKKTPQHHQLIESAIALKKDTETHMPLYDTALRRAAAFGALFELKVFIAYLPHENLNRGDHNLALTALHWAVIRKQFDCARALIYAHVDPDCQDVYGKTPLHFAVQNQDREMIKLLLQAGASLEIVDIQQNKPCDGASTDLVDYIAHFPVRVGI